MKDAPKLVISPVYSQLYQYWFQIDDIKKDDKTFRRYVFLSYFSVANQGLRDVAVDKWRLHIKNRLGLIQFYDKKKKLPPYTLPETQYTIGGHVKSIRSFGQNTQNFKDSSTMVKSGDSIAGMACWVYSVWGDEGWNPKKDKYNRVKSTLKIKNVFGDTSKCKLVFQKTTLGNLKDKFSTIADFFEKSREQIL